MAKTGVEMPLQVGETVGDDQGKYHWQVAVQTFQFNPDQFDTSTLNTSLFKVRVTVNWGDEQRSREVKLVTLKLVNKVL